MIDRGSGSFRVMTGNVLENQADPRQLEELIDRLDPDLVFLQEMGAAPARVLSERFEYHHLIPGTECRGRGVASKHPGEFGSLDLPWRHGVYARLSISGSTFTGAGVHMPNPIVFPWNRSIRQRQDQVHSLLSWADEQRSDGLIIAGDMNASPAWPLYRQLAERFDDLPQQAANRAGTRPEPTWGWRPGWPRMLRIDHVFGRGIAAARTGVHRIRGSDHHAVVVDLTVE